MNLGRVRLETHHHPGAVPAEIPNSRRHGPLGLGRKTIKPPRPVLVAPTAPFQAPLRNVVPLDFFLGPRMETAKGNQTSQRKFHDW